MILIFKVDNQLLGFVLRFHLLVEQSWFFVLIYALQNNLLKLYNSHTSFEMAGYNKKKPGTNSRLFYTMKIAYFTSFFR